MLLVKGTQRNYQFLHRTIQLGDTYFYISNVYLLCVYYRNSICIRHSWLLVTATFGIVYLIQGWVFSPLVISFVRKLRELHNFIIWKNFVFEKVSYKPIVNVLWISFYIQVKVIFLNEWHALPKCVVFLKWRSSLNFLKSTIQFS